MAPYARLEEILLTLIGGGVSVATALLFGWWAILPIVLTLALLSFYRDPPRRIPQDVNQLLAAADGKIVGIDRDVEIEGESSTRFVRIRIFLSVFNVHINRAPCASEVVGVDYRPGEFINALNPEADERNEANTLILMPAPPLPGPVRVRQISGVLAKRIVCTAKDGDQLAIGQRYGMIKLGSRTEVCFPENPDWDIRVSMGQAVRAGITVLARLPMTRDER